MSSKGATYLSKRGLLLWHVIVALTFMTWSGCAYAPNLVPAGYPDEMDWRIIRSVAGGINYPVVMSVTRDQHSVDIYWKMRGEWIPWQVPFTAADEWRFVLTAPGVAEPLCQTKWQDAKESLKKVTCPVNVSEYIARPLIGEVDFRLSKETDPEAQYRIHHRTYYFIERPNTN